MDTQSNARLKKKKKKGVAKSHIERIGYHSDVNGCQIQKTSSEGQTVA